VFPCVRGVFANTSDYFYDRLIVHRENIIAVLLCVDMLHYCKTG
jgi:hypothetical protein